MTDQPVAAPWDTFVEQTGGTAHPLLKKWLHRYPDLPAFVEATNRRRRLLQALGRLRGRMSQASLASKIGSRQPAIVRLERGDSDPKVSTLERYAAALGLVFHWQLLTREGQPASSDFTWEADVASRQVGDIGLGAGALRGHLHLDVPYNSDRTVEHEGAERDAHTSGPLDRVENIRTASIEATPLTRIHPDFQVTASSWLRGFEQLEVLSEASSEELAQKIPALTV